MAFLNHFKLPVRYETGTELLTSFRQNDSTHISDHIHEWRRRRRMIKADIPDQFLVDWFVKCLLPYIAKDVALSGVTTEEEAILRAQQLDLVYSQSRVLYQIFPNAPRAETDPTKPTPGPHADGVIGSTANAVSQVANAMGQLSLHSNGLTAHSSSPSAQKSTPPSDILSVQKATTKGGQQPGGKKKGKNQKKDTTASGGNTNAGGDKKERRKVKFPCKLCLEDHLTHHCPKMEEAKRLLEQKDAQPQPAVLTNPFPPQAQQMVVGTNVPAPPQGGNQGAPPQGGGPSNAVVCFCESDVHVQTRARNYDVPEKESKGKEPSTSQSAPLQIYKPLTDMILRPPKGVLKRSTHNPNARAAQNYSIVEDLAQAPCAMSALEVLQSCPTQRKALLSAIGAVRSIPEILNLWRFTWMIVNRASLIMLPFK